MKRRLEGDHKAELVKELKAVGALVLSVHGHEMQQAGWPDVQVYHRVWTGHLELKREDGTDLSLNQKQRIRALEERGTNAFCLRVWNDHEWRQLEGRDGEPLGRTQARGIEFLKWLASKSGR